MKKIRTILLLAVAVNVGVLSVRAEVVAAWDFTSENTTAVPAGWTTWSTASISTVGASNVVGVLTLTHTAGDGSVKNTTPALTTESAVPLLAANDGVLSDYLKVDISQTFTLSGLTAGQQYRFQFTGHIFTVDTGARNIQIVMDGSTTANLFVPAGTAAANEAAYSPCFTFIATAADRDVVFVFNKIGAGASSGVSGMIVETIATPEPVQPPTFTQAGVGAGGSNFVMSWTSEQGQAFDLLESSDLRSWTKIAEDLPASTSTQTTYAVALDEEFDNQFYKVWSVDGRPPNIIMMFADDLGYGDLACYGHPYAKTPNLDKLATEGTLFRKFNVTGVTCNPSRTGLLTSRHPDSYPITTETYGFDQAQYGYEDRPSIMELLNDAGYKTGHFGKWHIGPVATNGTYGIDEIMVSGGGGLDPRGRDEMLYQDAINFIVANKDTNFYVNVMGRVTHAPIAPRDDLIASAGFTNLVVDRADFPGQQLQDIFDGIEENGGNIDTGMASYLTEVYYLDQFIGELLAKLDELGLRENTIVVFSSDQGAALPDYVDLPILDREFNKTGWSGGLRGQKHDQHEGGIRSPFIIRWPGYVPAGKINTESITSALDWLPTLCGIAEVPIDSVQFQGEDVLDIWMGSDRSRNGPQFWASSMKKDDWRIYFSGDVALELFDLSTDIAETNNLLTARPDIVAELTVIWQEWEASLP